MKNLLFIPYILKNKIWLFIESKLFNLRRGRVETELKIKTEFSVPRILIFKLEKNLIYKNLKEFHYPKSYKNGIDVSQSSRIFLLFQIVTCLIVKQTHKIIWTTSMRVYKYTKHSF